MTKVALNVPAAQMHQTIALLFTHRFPAAGILAALDARAVELSTKCTEPPPLNALDPSKKETALDGYKTSALTIE